MCLLNQSPNHALHRTAPCVTAPASAAAFPPAMQVPRRTPRSLSLGSLGLCMTTAQKRTFLSDVCYVLDQARAFREYRRSGAEAFLAAHPFRQTLHNALLESSLSFLRKINEFFGKDADASVRAFFSDYPLSWLWAKTDCDLINNRVMHLSLSHALEGDYDWAEFLDTHLPEAERRFGIFLERLRREQPELFKTDA
jgi:hypothetical protein